MSIGSRPGLHRFLALIIALAPCAASGQDPQPRDGAEGGAAADPNAAPPPELAPVDITPPPQGIESIEVSGERLDATNVQDEAQAITAFDMGALDKLHITNVDGLATNVPSLHVGQQGQAAIITLRGVGTENASLTGEAGVAFHVDGVSYGRPAAARVAFYDLEFLEVKRGPQGLLGGKNSTSGAIHVNTRDPSQEYEIGGDLLLGNYDRTRTRGALNVPLGSGEVAAARVAVYYENRDGYLDHEFKPLQSSPRRDDGKSRDLFDADNFGFRTKLRFSPLETLNVVIGYNYFKEGGNGPQADYVARDPWQPCAEPTIPFRTPPIDRGYMSVMPRFVVCRADRNRFAPGAEDRDPRKIYTNTVASQDDLYWGYSSKIDWDSPDLPIFGQTHLKLIGGLQRTETQFDWDFDGSSVVLFDLQTASDVTEYSGQLEWSGAGFAERLEWQTSLFVTKEAGDSLTISPGFGVANGQTGQTTAPQKLETEQTVLNSSYGAALHGTYRLNDALAFSLGGRWIKDYKESVLFRLTNNNNLEACSPGIHQRQPLPGGGVGFIVPTCKLTDRGTMWGSRLEYKPTDDHLVYVGVDRGYKSGGFALGGVGDYAPEKVWAYTLGSKSEFFDQRLTLNLENFFYAYQQMQLALIDGTEIRTENTDTRMYGTEFEVVALPIEGLQLRAILNYIHTETLSYFTLDPAFADNPIEEQRLTQREEAEETGGVFPGNRTCSERNPANPTRLRAKPCRLLGDRNGLDDYSGNQLSRSPKWKYTLSADWDLPLGRFGSLTPGVKYSWMDDTYYRVFNRDFDLQKAFHKTDVKLAWRSPEERWNAEIFVDNVENVATKDYILIGSRFFGAPPLAWYGAPRFYGLTIGFKY